jgi:hypothetical protein
VACICVYFSSFLSFVSGKKAKIKVSSLEKWRPFVSFNDGFGQFFQLFFFDFLEPDLHNPVSFFKTRVPRRRPLPLSEAQVTPVVGVWRVACTLQRALCSLACSLAHVTATLRHFLAMHGRNRVYGG